MDELRGALSALNRRFGLGSQLSFAAGPGGLVVAVVDNAQASARISLQGGQLLAWQPKDQAQPVIWLSPHARFAPRTAIRGGMPICWPWFGAHPENPACPAHGLARVSSWQVGATRQRDGGETEIALDLVVSEQLRALWPHPVRASLKLTIGALLQVELTSRNEGERACQISEALHSYFQIGDIADIRVFGLADGLYVDKVDNEARRRESGPVSFHGELDRVYIDTKATCLIEDARLARVIQIDKSGSATTVLWSPGAEKAGKMADVGADAWRQMVCVESANALDNALNLAPGASHSLALTCAVRRL